ncbi:hypothetical protein GGR52DRAFT_569750 [Hypoxylon sp. FL1284]|nr:hypothetical protein GGR52DRAFT_569750 [Hypoxylon sp. FL1284]
MPSSVTTAIPTSPVERWCLNPLEIHGGDRFECADAAPGFSRSEFQTFCCDGAVAGAGISPWLLPPWVDDHPVRLADLVLADAAFLAAPTADGGASREAPSCFWAYTVGAATQQVTLLAPPPTPTVSFGAPFSGVPEPPPPASAGDGISTSGTERSSGTEAGPSGTAVQGGSETATAPVSTPSGAAVVRAGAARGYVCLCLGLVAAGLV